MNFGDMWEEKTMKKHWRGVQNQALQTFWPDRVSDQVFERFWEQIGVNFGSKIEPKSIENLKETQMRGDMFPGRSRRAFWAPCHRPVRSISTSGEGEGGGVNPFPEG